MTDERLDGPAGRGVSAGGTFLQQTAVGWQVLPSLSPVRLTHAPGLICGRLTRITRQPTPRGIDGHEGFPSWLCPVIAHADREVSGASGSPFEPSPSEQQSGPGPRLVSADHEDDFPPCVTLLEQLVGLAHVVESKGGRHGYH